MTLLALGLLHLGLRGPINNASRQAQRSYLKIVSSAKRHGGLAMTSIDVLNFDIRICPEKLNIFDFCNFSWILENIIKSQI